MEAVKQHHESLNYYNIQYYQNDYLLGRQCGGEKEDWGILEGDTVMIGVFWNVTP
jgi:hypothetical protein